MNIHQSQLNQTQAGIIEAAKAELAVYGFVLEPDVKVSFKYNGFEHKEFTKRYTVDYAAGTLTSRYGNNIKPYPNKEGRLRISFIVDGERCQPQLSQAIFFIKYGFVPEVVDHFNRNPDDNSLKNLRPTNPAGNAKNRSVSKTSRTGICNISYSDNSKKPYRLNIAGLQTGFDNLADALIARDEIRMANGFFVANDKPKAEFIEEYNEAQFAIMLCSDAMTDSLADMLGIQELLAANDDIEPGTLTEEQLAEVREYDILTRMTRKKTKREEWYEEAAYAHYLHHKY